MDWIGAQYSGSKMGWTLGMQWAGQSLTGDVFFRTDWCWGHSNLPTLLAIEVKGCNISAANLRVELGGLLHMLESRFATQRDINSLEKGAKGEPHEENWFVPCWNEELLLLSTKGWWDHTVKAQPGCCWRFKVSGLEASCGKKSRKIPSDERK